MTPTTQLLEIDDLVVSFDGFRAIDGLSIRVARGELRFLIGPNGAGKTTLLRVILGLQRPSAGRVVVDGVELGGLSERPLSVSRPASRASSMLGCTPMPAMIMS